MFFVRNDLTAFWYEIGSKLDSSLREKDFVLPVVNTKLSEKDRISMVFYRIKS